MHDRAKEPRPRDRRPNGLASESADGAPVSENETPAAEHPWSGYASDQGEPGDIEEFDAPIAGTPDADARARAEVVRQLGGEPGLDLRDVDVDVASGEVRIQGSVGSEDARRRIELIARGVPGVNTVRNELEIRTGELEPPGERGHAA
jgi:BON domain-containing protein